MSMLQLRRPLLLMALLGALPLAAAACSKPSNSGIPTAADSAGATSRPSTTGDRVAFARCMRQHGVNVPDPTPGQADWGPEPDGPEPAGWDAAFKACKQLLPASDLPESTRPTPQELEALRAFAVCMRAHDIDMSDPTPTGNMTIGGRLEHVTRAQLQNDPGFKAAEAACRDKLPQRETQGGAK
jgi:hypothetical protein